MLDSLVPAPPFAPLRQMPAPPAADATTLALEALTALSPLDGRYGAKVAALREHFSEFGLIRARVRVEVAWLVALSEERAIAEVAPFPRRRARRSLRLAKVSPSPTRSG